MTDEVRTISSTGGRKGQKLERPDLIPAKALRELATHYGIGAAKYTEVDDQGNITHDGANNWRLGYEWSKSTAGLLRHVLAFLSGEDIDAETGSKHVIAAAWHCLTLATFMDDFPSFDDRYDSPAARLARNPEVAERLGLITESDLDQATEVEVGTGTVEFIEADSPAWVKSHEWISADDLLYAWRNERWEFFDPTGVWEVSFGRMGPFTRVEK